MVKLPSIIFLLISFVSSILAEQVTPSLNEDLVDGVVSIIGGVQPQLPFLKTGVFPETDPTSIFELFRGSHSTELLAAAIELKLFVHLNAEPMSFGDLRAKIGLSERAANVLITALRAMELITRDANENLVLTPLSREHLTPGGQFEVSDYIGLAAQSPAVLAMRQRLLTDKPAGSAPGAGGAAFIFREGIESAMESEASARHLTLALAGRAKNVAPYLAKNLPMINVTHLLDVGGGTGIYSIALLQKHPQLIATVLDRPEVLKIAAEFAQAYGVADRLNLIAGDIFTSDLTVVTGEHPADLILLSNVLHDWDVPACQSIISRCAAVLPTNGRLVIHDVFLNDDLGGPLPLALYSATLFTLTEGRAYSAGEYAEMLSFSGLKPQLPVIPTLVHCGLLQASKM